jgi:hypothetical protein
MKSKLKRLGFIVVASWLVVPIWLLAYWYRSDRAFSDVQRFTVEWAGAWFFGIVGGLIITGIGVGALVAVSLLLRWIWRGDQP